MLIEPNSFPSIFVFLIDKFAFKTWPTLNWYCSFRDPVSKVIFNSFVSIVNGSLNTAKTFALIKLIKCIACTNHCVLIFLEIQVRFIAVAFFFLLN